MAKKGNDMNRLINEAIDASIEFEALMDSIDFNSYLPEKQERDDVKQTERYQIYKDRVRKVLRSCQDVIDNIPTEIKDFIPPENPDKNKLTQYLIFHLFEAKKIRLEGREQIKREEEDKKYSEATHKLHKALYHIEKENSYETQKTKRSRLQDNFNWAEVLFYNEFAICYAGLTESSMSLGYAEKAISALEKIRPQLKKSQANIKLKNDRILRLYTFALYNKGEAERLLHNDDLSLRTFRKIIEICKPQKKKSSDYYSALLHIALILIDQGRGTEAIDRLSRVRFPGRRDYRIQERDLEKASAFIDQKEYKKAYCILKGYTENMWKYTFAQRKAKVYRLRLLIEFKRNRPKDLDESKEEWTKEIKGLYGEFGETAIDLLEDCIRRYDADDFKKTCTYLAEYFHEKKKLERELLCYCLYLFYEIILKKPDVLTRKSKRAKRVLADWTSPTGDLGSLIEQYENKNLVRFSEILGEVDDEPYLRGFFKAYSGICIEREYKPNEKEKAIVGELRKRLSALYREKDNLVRLGEVEEEFRRYQDKIEPKGNRDKEKKECVKFVRECFFRGKQINGDKQMIYLRPDSVTTRMEQNTDDFVHKVVGRTKLLPQDEVFRGRLIVLRRWNSFTPSLASSVNPSKGGGYFLYFWYKNERLGIAIDPGYDFLDNLFSQGFRIGDINVVIVSHAHPDHTDNLPSILSLFHKLNGRLGEHHYNNKFNRKHLKLILSQGVFDQYYKLIKPSEASLKDILVVETSKDRQTHTLPYVPKFDGSYSLKIQTFATSHKDLSQWESLGFKFEIINDSKIISRIGYTSDAHWTQGFSEQFKHCNIVCAHLGSIVDILGDKDFCSSLCESYAKSESGKCKTHVQCKEEGFENGNPTYKKLLEQAQEQNHLYLSGLAMFFGDLLSKSNEGNDDMKLAVISEFGEELKGGIRMDLYHKFDDWFKAKSRGNARCVPGDIGLEIDLLNHTMCCCCCQEYKSKDRISPIAYGKEEAIFFVCDECKSVLSSYQIEEKLRHYYENGRKLELADEST